MGAREPPEEGPTMSNDELHNDESEKPGHGVKSEQELAGVSGNAGRDSESSGGEGDWRDFGSQKASDAAREWKRRARQEREKYYRREGREFPRLARALAVMVQAASHHFRFNGLPGADIIFCLLMRVYYYHFSARRLDFKLEELQRAGYMSKVPHANTVLYHLRQKGLTLLLERMIGMTSLPFQIFDARFAVDSTKIITAVHLRDEDGNVVMRGERKLRKWIKLHYICGLSSLSVMAARATPWLAQDVKYLRPLLAEALDRGHTVRSVAADKGYLSKENYRFIHDCGADAFITFKTNSRLSKNGADPMWDENLSRFREMRNQETQPYNERILIEAVNWMIKSRFGREVRGITETAQFNEALLKVICHNLTRMICYQIGLEDKYVDGESH